MTSKGNAEKPEDDAFHVFLLVRMILRTISVRGAFRIVFWHV